MKTRTLATVALIGASLALSGCDQVKKLVGGGKPTGQVVATVHGEEITSLQLRAELGNFASRDPAVMKAAQQQALQRIILRRLLAEEARKLKLDKGTDYTLQVERGEETLLAQLYQRKLAAKIARPTKAEAEAYVASHPLQFGSRKVLFLDQVMAGPNKIQPDRFRPLKTLPEVRALLDSEGVVYQDNAITLDTLSTNPQIVSGIMNLPPGEIFVIPQGGALVFNQITSSRDAPLRGEPATNYAMNILRQQKAQEQLGKQVADLQKASESEIVYNPAYKPAPPVKPGAKVPASPPASASAPAAK